MVTTPYAGVTVAIGRAVAAPGRLCNCTGGQNGGLAQNWNCRRLAIITRKQAIRARSSTGQSSGLLIRRFRVRVPAGVVPRRPSGLPEAADAPPGAADRPGLLGRHH